MDDTRIQRRIRARPYDLRRKVLLKNFLRDQMTYVPASLEESFPKCGSSTTEDEDLLPDEDLSHEINEQASSSAVVDDAVESISSPSNDEIGKKYISENEVDLTEEIDVVTIDKSDIAINSNHDYSNSSSFVKFTSLFKKDNKNTSKGIRKTIDTFKAKRSFKPRTSSMRTRSFKRNFERVFYGQKRSHAKSPSNQMTKNPSRSFFSLFKHRREERRDTNTINSRSSENPLPMSMNVPTKSRTINQYVQTDDSWVKEEVNRVHQSNRRLQEENKLLSESLSYYMSNSSMNSPIRQCSSPFQPSNENENSLIFHDYSVSPSSSYQDYWNSRSKVFRSKSVHESNERYKVLRNNYRTKSMNVHNSRNYLTNYKPLLPTPTYNDRANMPRLRKRNNMTNNPYNYSSSRNIQRHSSMPERRLSENDRWVTYGRSNSMRNTHNRKPFYALSADAFY